MASGIGISKDTQRHMERVQSLESLVSGVVDLSPNKQSAVSKEENEQQAAQDKEYEDMKAQMMYKMIDCTDEGFGGKQKICFLTNRQANNVAKEEGGRKKIARRLGARSQAEAHDRLLAFVGR